MVMSLQTAFRRWILKNATRFIIACVALAFAPARSDAGLVFDNYTPQASLYPTATSRAAASDPLTFVTVSTTTTISQIGVFNSLGTAGNIEFLIFGSDSTLLYFGASQAFAGDLNGADTWKYSSTFSFTLQAGQSYYIGFITDVAMTEPFALPSSPYTQNGITAANSTNGNDSNFASPILSGSGLAELPLQLFSPAVVPEPSSVVLCGIAGAVGLVVARARRRPA
jgi:hypothetical protein